MTQPSANEPEPVLIEVGQGSGGAASRFVPVTAASLAAGLVMDLLAGLACSGSAASIRT